jgi:predicted DNA-binding transcriptional regulator YafY
MGPNERRMEIMEVLCQRRHDTMKNLAFEFGVTERTIRNDISILSLSYPLETIRGRYGGGVKVMDGFYMNRKYLKPEQKKLVGKA